MKYFYLVMLPLLMLSCTNGETALKGPEHLKFRIDEAVLISRLEDIDSADVNVQYVKSTQYFFKKYDQNNLWLTLYLKSDVSTDDDFLDKRIKLYKLSLEHEILNYFAYDGLIIDFYQEGEKVKTYEQSFEE